MQDNGLIMQFQIPEGTFKTTIARARARTREGFQIPEGTFKTGGGFGAPRSATRRFKSPKERLKRKLSAQ